ncbi:MFS transporter [Streptomyces sp. DT171]|uniref:MFS transporter n=1 Tax=Streptomyces sp. DT171 TaxID=3416524 RepID=UPI003CF7744B
MSNPTTDIPHAGAPHGWRDFRFLWAGQSLSLMGDQFMLIALPLLAVTVLGASLAQAALLPFALKLPFLVLGLPAGAMVDRLPKRPVLIVSEAVQLASCLVIAVLAVAHRLPFWSLMVLVGISGCANVFFQVAYTSYLPALIEDPRRLHQGNVRLQLSESVSRSLGPMAAGPMIALAGPAAAVLANAASFLISLLTLRSIRHREEPPRVTRRERGWLGREIREGITFIRHHAILQPVLLCGGVYVLFQSTVISIIVLYCKDVLHLPVAVIGLVVGVAALGYPIGNLLCGRLVDRFGQIRTIVLGASLSVLGFVIMPVAGSAGSVVGLVVASMLHGVGEGSFGPTWLTLRQTLTPAGLLGRVNSVERFLLWGAVPLGSLLAASSIRLLDLSAALWIGSVGTALCLPVLMRRGVLAGLRRGAAPLSE